MGLQKCKRTQWHDDDALLFLSDWCVCIGVKYLQDGFTKFVKYLQDGFTKMQTHQWSEPKLRDFGPLLKEWWTAYVSTQIWVSSHASYKSFCKIFARWVYKNTNACDDMTFVVRVSSDWCVCIGVKYWQDGFTPIQTHAMTWWWCVAFFFGLVRLYRGKIFARWVYPYTNARDDMTMMRCFFSDWCVCIGVKYLQDGFSKIKNHPKTLLG